ncbi:MAG TPA: hypothetical protein VK171_04335 [Fimbriimonas sp.]|nr:hypothetical protein [Fimbriimonas sp.]
MFVTTLVASVMGLVPPMAPAGPFVERITVKISTGADDLRKDSNVMLIMNYSGGRREGMGTKRPDETWGANHVKTITFVPKYRDLTLEDLQQLRLDFRSGKSTGFDDHWLLKDVSITAVVGGREQKVYDFMGVGMHLKYTQHWMSPFFPKFKSNEMINPGDVWGEIEGTLPGDRAQLLLDLETEDGRFWSGRRSVAQLKDAFNPGLRVQSEASDKVAVTSIRAFRVGYGNVSRNIFELSNTSSSRPYTLRGIRFFYKDSSGAAQELVSYNEANAAFSGAGWWEPAAMKPLARRQGDPIRLFMIEVMSGRDDLRRTPITPELSAVYNSKVDISFATVIAPEHPRYGEWMMDSANVKKAISGNGTFYEQDRDDFPEGWDGRYYEYGRFFKEFRVKGDPIFLSSDFIRATVKFRQGGGGSLLPTQNRGGGLIEALRQPDNWDLAGLIISYQAPDGTMRRIYSNFAINQRMDRDGKEWRSPNFDTLQLRKKPF